MAPARSIRIAIGGAVAAAAMTVSLASPAQAASRSGWHVVYRFAPGGYAGYTEIAVSGSHAWAVGSGRSVAADGLPAAAYYANGKWSVSPLPRTQYGIGAIDTVSSDGLDDAWAAAPGGVLHWHKGKWRFVRRWRFGDGGPPGPLMTGINALSPDNVWVFSPTNYGIGSWHLHGRTWTRLTGAGREIYAASALSATDMWAIGGPGNGSILHYVRGTWRYVSGPAQKGLAFGAIFASSPTSVWVTASPAGKTALQLLHLQGTRWTAYPMPWSLPLTAFQPPQVAWGSVSPDGRGGFWITAAPTEAGQHWLLHFSSSGKWSRFATGLASIRNTVRIPGTAELWGAGWVPQHGLYSFTNAEIWGYGKSR